jgi:gluconolactonase
MPMDLRSEYASTERVLATWERHHRSFDTVDGDAWVELLYTGGRWLEGPTYFPASRQLVFSDIPNNRILRWDETTGAVGLLRSPSHYANGHTRDRAGRLVTCEQGSRRVTRTEHDGTVMVLADRVEGRRFNSPNDVVEHADGSIWFTDPSYGITTDYEGVRAEPELDGCHVYRLDPDSGALTIVADDFDRPNGLAFSADGCHLYVADTRRRHIREFAVTPDGGLKDGQVLCESPVGSFDGLRLDTEGRIWAATRSGVHIFSSEGNLLGALVLPEAASNLTFGGLQRNHLFVTATSTLYSLRLNVSGL